MNRAVAACWTFVLLSALFCETVLSKGGRGGARGAARGSARGSRTRTRFKVPRRYSSSPARVAVAGAAAGAGAGMAAGMAAGAWYGSSYGSAYGSAYRRSDGGNGTDSDFYSYRTSGSTARGSGLFPPFLALLGSFSLLQYSGL